MVQELKCILVRLFIGGHGCSNQFQKNSSGTVGTVLELFFSSSTKLELNSELFFSFSTNLELNSELFSSSRANSSGSNLELYFVLERFLLYIIFLRDFLKNRI